MIQHLAGPVVSEFLRAFAESVREICARWKSDLGIAEPGEGVDLPEGNGPGGW